MYFYLPHVDVLMLEQKNPKMEQIIVPNDGALRAQTQNKVGVVLPDVDALGASLEYKVVVLVWDTHVAAVVH